MLIIDLVRFFFFSFLLSFLLHPPYLYIVVYTVSIKETYFVHGILTNLRFIQVALQIFCTSAKRRDLDGDCNLSLLMFVDIRSWIDHMLEVMFLHSPPFCCHKIVGEILKNDSISNNFTLRVGI